MTLPHTKSRLPLIGMLIVAVSGLWFVIDQNRTPAEGAPAAGSVNGTIDPGDQASSAAPDPDRPAHDDRPAASAAPDLSIPSRPADLFGTGMRIFHGVSRVGNEVFDGVMGLSTQEEIAIGKQVHSIIRTRHKVLDAPRVESRLRSLAEPFVAACERQGITYRFFVIEDDSLNAFAHLGGYVYVHTGLLDRIQDDDELRFVLGHEVAHCDRRHCVRSMNVVTRTEEITGPLGGNLASIAYRAIAVGYSEDYEFESDRVSYQRMRAIGRSHNSAMAGLNMLARELHPGERPDTNSSAPGVFDHVKEHFRSHPEIHERIARLERLSRQ